MDCCFKFFWATNALYRNYPATLDWNGPLQLKSLGEHDWHVKLRAPTGFEPRAGSTAWAHLTGAFDHSATPSPSQQMKERFCITLTIHFKTTSLPPSHYITRLEKFYHSVEKAQQILRQFCCTNCLFVCLFLGGGPVVHHGLTQVFSLLNTLDFISVY